MHSPHGGLICKCERTVGGTAVLDPIRFLRHRERFNAAVEEEVALLVRRHGEEAYRHVVGKLRRDDLTSRYRKVLEKVAARLR